MAKDSKSVKSGEYVFIKSPMGLKFVGKFDELYSDMKDPWGQIEDSYYGQRRLKILNSISELSPDSVLDVGCGFGHVTQAVKILTTKDVVGVDISKVAIKRAKGMFPQVRFKQLDISKKFLRRKFDVVLLNGILWYILDDLVGIFKRIYNGLNYDGHLVISQAFIKDQQYGKEKIDGYEGLIKYLNKHWMDYKLVKTEYCDTGTRKTDSITILQKRRVS